MRRIVRALLVCAMALVFGGVVIAQDKATPPEKPPVNLNTASIDQLDGLPGIGRATAQRILEYRQKVGSFTKIEQLMNVKGIGEKSFLKLKPLIVVQPKTEKPAGQ